MNASSGCCCTRFSSPSACVCLSLVCFRAHSVNYLFRSFCNHISLRSHQSFCIYFNLAQLHCIGPFGRLDRMHLSVRTLRRFWRIYHTSQWYPNSSAKQIDRAAVQRDHDFQTIHEYINDSFFFRCSGAYTTKLYDSGADDGSQMDWCLCSRQLLQNSVASLGGHTRKPYRTIVHLFISIRFECI